MTGYHLLQLSEPWYSLVKNGKRTVDVRCDVNDICEGDVIGFYKDVDRWDDTIRCKVIRVQLYEKVDTMSATELMFGEEMLSILNDMQSATPLDFIVCEFVVLE